MLARVLCRLFALAIATAMAAPALADPTLRVDAQRSAQRGSVLSFLWNQSWWLEVDARSDTAPIARIEYWAQVLEGSRRRTAGSFPAPANTRAWTGSIPIRFPTNADHDERLRVRLRVHDTAGNASDWHSVEFPDDAVLADGPSQPQAKVDAAAAPKRSTVEVVAGDTMSLGDVREALTQEAGRRGGRIVSEPRLVGTVDGKMRFEADIEIVPEEAPTAAPVAAAPQRIGEIHIPDAPLR